MTAVSRIVGVRARVSVLILGATATLLAAESRADPELHWYRGNTHVHTLNSDGNATPDAVARWYREHGYQFLVITDHEYLTNVSGLNDMLAAAGKFLIIQGEEVTQNVTDPRRGGAVLLAHVNGIGVQRLVHAMGDAYLGGIARMAPAGTPIGTTLARNIQEIRGAGGIAQVNHPNSEWSITPGDLQNVTGWFLLEVMNPGSNDLGGTDDSGAVGLSTEELWDALLSRGQIVWGVGSDDCHDFHEVAGVEISLSEKAWIAVRAKELSKEAIMQAIARGDFYASNGVELEDVSSDAHDISLRIQARTAPANIPPPATRYMTRFIGQGGRVLASIAGLTPRYHLRGDEHYVRAVVTDSNGKRAWTQPVFAGRTSGPRRTRPPARRLQ